MTNERTKGSDDDISLEGSRRKRPLNLADSSAQESETKKSNTKLEAPGSEQLDPAYGTKDYWEMRYKGFKDDFTVDKDAPEALHSWYFTYEDLSPLLVPLIVGDENPRILSSERGKNDQEEDFSEEETDLTQQGSNNEIESTDELPADVASDDQWEESVEGYDDEEEEEEEEVPERPGLARGGPIEVLEIGCGDVPLGTGLISGIVELESQGLLAANKTLKRVICMDYSKHVIDDMKAKQKLGKFGSGPLNFECADARKLPYNNESFKLILEKGTMDATLSDKESGSDNCRAIVSEMARVLLSRGCAVVISHLNANSEEGLKWLESIIVPGLRSGAGQFDWHIEIHGGEPSDNNKSDEKSCDSNIGPAVYFIQKGERFSSQNKASSDSDVGPPTIPLRFFSY